MSSGALDAAISSLRVVVGAHVTRGTDALSALVSTAGHRVVGASQAARELIDVATSQSCELVVLDASGWTTMDVLALGEEIKIAVALPVVVVCEQLEPTLCRHAKASGIDAVLLRPVDAEQLVAAVEFVLGASAATPSSDRSGTYALDTTGLDASGVPDLSAREREVFELLARGSRPSEIGRELFISEHTVRKHAKLIFRKLGVHSQVELMRRHFRRTD